MDRPPFRDLVRAAPEDVMQRAIVDPSPAHYRGRRLSCEPRSLSAAAQYRERDESLGIEVTAERARDAPRARVGEKHATSVGRGERMYPRESHPLRVDETRCGPLARICEPVGETRLIDSGEQPRPLGHA